MKQVPLELFYGRIFLSLRRVYWWLIFCASGNIQTNIIQFRRQMESLGSSILYKRATKNVVWVRIMIPNIGGIISFQMVKLSMPVVQLEWCSFAFAPLVIVVDFHFYLFVLSGGSSCTSTTVTDTVHLIDFITRYNKEINL